MKPTVGSHAGSTKRTAEPLLTIVVLALVSATTTWWLVGDLTEATSGSMTYVLDPPNISAGWVRAIGIGSAVVGGIAVAGSLYGSATGRWDPGWGSVVAMVAGAGIIVGYGWRVLTAGVTGANQGAGLVVLLGVPMVLGLLGTAAVRSFSLSRR